VANKTLAFSYDSVSEDRPLQGKSNRKYDILEIAKNHSYGFNIPDKFIQVLDVLFLTRQKMSFNKTRQIDKNMLHNSIQCVKSLLKEPI
jgi:hypothetical protein